MSVLYDNCLKVKKAARTLASTDTETKNEVLKRFAEKLDKSRDELKLINKQDVSEATATADMSDAFIERLTLSDKTIDGMISGIAQIIDFKDPVGVTLYEKVLENGLKLKKISVPLGVIGIIYEARPNVTADSAALCFKSGNACVLRGGKEALRTNKAVYTLMREALTETGVDENCIYLIEDTTRESTNEMMKLNGLIDVLIPRGGKGLINAVVKNATVPVIETGAGNCHMYIDEAADLQMGVKLAVSAKISRPSVCNSLEKLLVSEKVSETFLPDVYKSFRDNGVEVRGCEKTRAILGDRVKKADENDWFTEYNDMIIAVKVVKDVYEAVEHINKYSTGHSEAIITEDDKAAEYFFKYTDSAAVYRNASTRFTDGGVFGLGAEIGISTQKLHARGPMGMAELTSCKYIINGNGQTR